MRFLTRAAALGIAAVSLTLLACPPVIQQIELQTQTVSLANMQGYRLEPTGLGDAYIRSSALVNSRNDTNTYTIYKLPYISTDASALNLRLKVILGNAASLDLQNKGYFSVVSNAGSVAKNPYAYVQRSVESGSGAMEPAQEPFTVLSPQQAPTRLRRSITAQSAAQNQQQYFDGLIEYPPAPNTTADVRTFNFNYLSRTKSSATLYKKLEFVLDGQTLRFAIWLDDTNFSAAAKAGLKTKIDAFAKIIFDAAAPSNNSIYKMLHTLNNGHLWGRHSFGGVAAPEDSVIHIGLGALPTQGSGTVLGFVDARTLFYNLSTTGSYVPEEIIAPTIYLNRDLLTNTGRAKQQLYMTFAHEAQHAFTNYRKMILQSNSIADLNNRNIETWVHEVLSLTAEYLTGLSIFKLAPNTQDYVANYAQFIYDTRYSLLRYSLFFHGFTDNSNFDSWAYNTAFAFGGYLVQNYGISMLNNLVNNALPGGQTFVQAAQQTSEYASLPSYLRPARIEDMLLDFFTSLFVSDNIQDLGAKSNYKFFTSQSAMPRVITFGTGALGASNYTLGSIIDVKYGALDFPLMTFDAANLTVLAGTSGASSSSNYMPPSNITDTWFGNLGPFIFNPSSGGSYYPQSYGQHAALYLAGRVNQNLDKAGERGVVKTDMDGNAYVQFDLTRGMAASIIVVE